MEETVAPLGLVVSRVGSVTPSAVAMVMSPFADSDHETESSEERGKGRIALILQRSRVLAGAFEVHDFSRQGTDRGEVGIDVRN